MSATDESRVVPTISTARVTVGTDAFERFDCGVFGTECRIQAPPRERARGSYSQSCHHAQAYGTLFPHVLDASDDAIPPISPHSDRRVSMSSDGA